MVGRINLVGAGEMAELAAKHLLNHGASKILIANRTYENAVKLAEEMNGEPVRFEDFGRRLGEADVVICSTGAPHYLISPAQVKQALKESDVVAAVIYHSPRFLLDLPAEAHQSLRFEALRERRPQIAAKLDAAADIDRIAKRYPQTIQRLRSALYNAAKAEAAAKSRVEI